MAAVALGDMIVLISVVLEDAAEEVEVEIPKEQLRQFGTDVTLATAKSGLFTAGFSEPLANHI